MTTMSSLYLAPTAAAATVPRLLPPPRRIDIRRLKGDMALQVPPRRPPPRVVSTNNRYTGAKHKAVVVMGATGTGKSRLAVDLALEFGGDVINSDKIQLYEGLDVATNKVTEEERAGVPHHLIGVARPDDQFTATDFRHEASSCARAVAASGRLPIVAGGSNSFVQELVDGDLGAFRDRFDLCFLWVDAQLPVLHGHVACRVDDMCARGLVAEVAAVFDPARTDYARGIWRAIGVPELDAYLRWSGGSGGEDERARRMLANAIEDIKSNTYVLACRQRAKIEQLTRLWRIVRVDATEVLRRRGIAAGEAWQRLVAAPCIDAVRAFLNDDESVPADDLLPDVSEFAQAAVAV
jgi:adenylate dimethylallyltransferase (cytokinin synthase)